MRLPWSFLPGVKGRRRADETSERSSLGAPPRRVSDVTRGLRKISNSRGRTRTVLVGALWSKGRRLVSLDGREERKEERKRVSHSEAPETSQGTSVLQEAELHPVRSDRGGGGGPTETKHRWAAQTSSPPDKERGVVAGVGVGGWNLRSSRRDTISFVLRHSLTLFLPSLPSSLLSFLLLPSLLSFLSPSFSFFPFSSPFLFCSLYFCSRREPKVSLTRHPCLLHQGDP